MDVALLSEQNSTLEPVHWSAQKSRTRQQDWDAALRPRIDDIRINSGA
jgi:hypothetical protein